MNEVYTPVPATTPDDLRSLAAVAREQLRDPKGAHPAFVIARPARRAAAAAVDVGAAVVLGVASGCTVFAVLLVVFREDFDGPPQYEAAGDWLFWSCVSLVALAYSGAEAFAGRAVGKWVTGLLVVSTADPPRRGGHWRRWAVKASPLICVAVVCVAGFVHTEWLGWEAFDDFGWRAGWEVVLAFAVPAVFCVAMFLRCLGPDGQATYDRLAGTIVVRPTYTQNAQRRGFEVVPTAAPERLVEEQRGVIRPPGE